MPYKDPQKRREAAKSWKAAHPEKVRVFKAASERRRYTAKREIIRAKQALYYTRNKEKIHESQKDYVARNLEAIRAYQEQYRAEHRERIMAQKAAYRLANKERIRQQKALSYQIHKETSITYRLENKERIAQRSSLYRKAHRAERSFNETRRRSRKAAAPRNDLTISQWRAIKKLYNYRCVYCPTDCQMCQRHTHRLTQDHIEPLSRGGSHTVQNIVPACKACNSKKGTRKPLKPVQPLLFAV